MALPEDPLWYKDAVVYQVHVKSFFDSNDDGVGDLAGMTRKLDYIASLGVSAVWLLPFYPSPRRDDGYDIADYRSVHPEYGTFRDFRRFVAEAHKRNLRVITELVINHTSDQHPWFQRARRAKPGSVYRDFYVWREDDKSYADTRIIFIDTEKSNWTRDDLAGGYFWHRFYSHQPDLNFDNPRVLKEVLAALRFWLDTGVDGLRLDAVPYLCEREGTNNENLPETHAVIRQVRAEINKKYSDKMLLAEANQWPEDVQEYFGDGDECHMAFHFPLMPRMYMSVAQEDRYPITDILRQTPEIPPACQWAIFLRNHDELTLEMVTVEERDYLWRTYATDPRARLNLGIRRRLAPLMDHDRRRIELMNGLLLSMPGTPVVYYGDEIGMGDNIFLGDRDGVRTPMQWSPDRNGGFSRADPARLVLPPIMDALYGFDAVNVEAQTRNPHSLLNWMRRLIAVRQSRRVFGRGVLRFLYPGNRKVLAFIREHEGESILCVNNLSRTAQSVELELPTYKGRVPIELLGRTAFPPVGDLPYLVTLPPYGFLWFLLAADAEVPAWHSPAQTPMPDFHTFVLRDGWARLLEGDQRRTLEESVLPTYLPLRRWFSGKGDRLKRADIPAVTAMPVGKDDALWLEIDADGGGQDRYLLPLALAWDNQPQSAPTGAQLALARVRRGPRVGFVTDATSQDWFLRAVVAAMRKGARIADSKHGDIVFRPSSRLIDVELQAEPEIARFSAEQSNTTILIDSKLVLKFVRRTYPGVHPEAEMGRYLTEQAGFAAIPAYMGEIVRLELDGRERLLCVAQAFVRNQGDGWTWLREQLKQLLDDPVPLVEDQSIADSPQLTQSLGFVKTLGRRIGEMHAALTLPTEDSAFAPEPIAAADVAAWTQAARAEAAATLALLEKARSEAPEIGGEDAAELTARRRELDQMIARLGARLVGGQKMRIHGDLHLGQVLFVAGDAVIVDFEGEPARSLDERRAKSSPARDIAGMVRSFDYVVRTAIADDAATHPVDPKRKAALTGVWGERITKQFMEAYFDAAKGCSAWPRDHRARKAMIEFFTAWKAVYELRYELNNRPQWSHLPIGALIGLLGPRRSRS